MFVVMYYKAWCEYIHLFDSFSQVHGIVRRSSSFNTGRIEHLYQNPQTHTEGSKYPVYTTTSQCLEPF